MVYYYRLSKKRCPSDETTVVPALTVHDDLIGFVAN
jgi:hypothetical protein|tara:strand:- start:959 stop:1066 length:108 start_codon:yes stop_codon:yes gene_type:complete